MRLAEAISWVSQTAKIADLDPVRAERAIEMVCNHLLRRTGVGRKTGDITFTQDDETIDIPTTLTDFRPERMRQIYITTTGTYKWQSIAPRAFATVTEMHINSSSTLAPNVIGWATPADGIVFPTPDAAYTAKVIYDPPAIDRLEDDPVLNVPDEYVQEALWYGATAAVDLHNQQAGYHTEAWRRFETYVDEIAGLSADTGMWEGREGMT